MDIKVRVYGDLRNIIKKEEFSLNLPEGSTVSHVLHKLSEDTPEDVKRTVKEKLMGALGKAQRSIVILVNGCNVNFLSGAETRLSNGDVIDLLPLAAGG